MYLYLKKNRLLILNLSINLTEPLHKSDKNSPTVTKKDIPVYYKTFNLYMRKVMMRKQ